MNASRARQIRQGIISARTHLAVPTIGPEFGSVPNGTALAQRAYARTVNSAIAATTVFARRERLAA